MQIASQKSRKFIGDEKIENQRENLGGNAKIYLSFSISRKEKGEGNNCMSPALTLPSSGLDLQPKIDLSRMSKISVSGRFDRSMDALLGSF